MKAINYCKVGVLTAFLAGRYDGTGGLLGGVHALSQETKLSTIFCTDKSAPPIFHTSITSLTTLYEYLVPVDDTLTEVDVTRSQVSIFKFGPTPTITDMTHSLGRI